MNRHVIWGLMRKDFAILAKQLRFIAVYLVLFTAVFSFALEGSQAIIIFLSVMGFMMSINCFAYDETAGFDKLAAALPAAKREIVAARYLSALCIGLAGAVLMLGVNTAALAARSRQLPDIPGILLMLGAMAAVSVIMISIIFPLIYKFGVSKSRLLMLLMCAVPGALIGALGNLFPGTETLPPALNLLIKMLPSLLTVVAVAALLISVTVSARILRNKEY